VENEGDRGGGGGIGLLAALEDVPEANSAIISACLVGLLTGFGVVLFNYVVSLQLLGFFSPLFFG